MSDQPTNSINNEVSYKNVLLFHTKPHLFPHPGPHFVAVNNKNEIIVTDFHNHSVKVKELSKVAVCRCRVWFLSSSVVSRPRFTMQMESSCSNLAPTAKATASSTLPLEWPWTQTGTSS